MGPRDQSLFWGVFCSVGMAGCYFFACFVPECSGMELSATVGVKLLAWNAVVGFSVVTLAVEGAGGREAWEWQKGRLVYTYVYIYIYTYIYIYRFVYIYIYCQLSHFINSICLNV